MSPVYEMAAAGWGGVEWLESRGDSMTKSAGFLTQAAAGTDGNSTNSMLLNQFKLDAARSIRTSTIILATFNTIAAFATAMGILYDAYSRERRNNRSFKFTRNGFTFVPATDVYPLILTLGITVQSATFAVAQSTGLDSLFGNGCTTVSQLMLPAVFIAPYIQLVFGLEITLRGLHKKKPFQPRGKWTVTICMTIVGLLILVNFLVADFDRSYDFCFSSLFFFIAHYSRGCFIALALIIAVLLACAVLIFVRLHRSIKIEVTERVVASRMVYYLALAVISNSFLMPYFFTMAFMSGAQGQGITLSMVAAVVANVSGLMTGGLYLFLKSNTISTIGPRDKIGEYERQKMKSKIRRYNTGDSHAMGPMGTGAGSLQRSDSQASLISNDKAEEAGSTSTSPTLYSPALNPLRSNAVFPSTTAVPRPPEPAQIANSSSKAPSGHMRKRSYSVFPVNTPSNKASVTLLPATTYSPNLTQANLDSLKPPPSMGNLINRHRRDSSMVSSATVQIGLRLSNVNDILMPPAAVNSQPPQVASSAESVYSLECPAERAKAALGRPGPLVSSEAHPLSDADETVVDATPRRDPVKDSRMKTLPPVPALCEPDDESEWEGGDSESDYEEPEAKAEAELKPMTLSPTVYTPPLPQSPTKAKLPSPRGVGFTVLAKSNSTSSNRPRSPRSPPMAPPRRTTGDPVAKDWI